MKKNPAFAAVVGLVYALYAWFLESASESLATYRGNNLSFIEQIQKGQVHTWSDLTNAWAGIVFHSPGLALLLVGILYGTIRYAVSFRRLTRSKGWPFIGGLVHGAAHLTAAVLLIWASAKFVNIGIKGTPDGSFWHAVWDSELIVFFLVWFFGFFASGTIMSIYMALANLLYGGHDQEVFSSQAIQDYKCFARFKLNKDGLTLYPVGITKVPRAWKPAEGVEAKNYPWWRCNSFALKVTPGTRRLFEPKGELKGHLIEPPVEIR